MFFKDFKGNKGGSQMIWQRNESLMPFVCSRCHRTLDGVRWLANSMKNFSHKTVDCICDDCHNGIDPNKTLQPKYGQRRTSLD